MDCFDNILLITALNKSDFRQQSTADKPFPPAVGTVSSRGAAEQCCPRLAPTRAGEPASAVGCSEGAAGAVGRWLPASCPGRQPAASAAHARLRPGLRPGPRHQLLSRLVFFLRPAAQLRHPPTASAATPLQQHGCPADGRRALPQWAVGQQCRQRWADQPAAGCSRRTARVRQGTDSAADNGRGPPPPSTAISLSAKAALPRTKLQYSHILCLFIYSTTTTTVFHQCIIIPL